MDGISLNHTTVSLSPADVCPGLGWQPRSVACMGVCAGAEVMIRSHAVVGRRVCTPHR
jgi:hypothetical protein